MKKPIKKASPSPRSRKPLPSAVETSVLTKCKRRCAFCYFFDGKIVVNFEGQLAHINRNREDDREENLAYLCQPHHNLYDSIPSQTKKLTANELREAKSLLENVMALHGKSGRLSAEIVIEADFDAFDEIAERNVMEKIRQIAKLNGEVVVRSKTKSSVKLTVDIAADDLAKLLIAKKSGALDDLRIRSVTLQNSPSNKPIGFSETFVSDSALSKSDAELLLFNADAVYEHRLGDNGESLLFFSMLSKNDSDTAVILPTAISVVNWRIDTPLFVRKGDIQQWPILNPFAAFKELVEKRGELITTPTGASKLFLDYRVSYFLFPGRTSVREQLERTFHLLGNPNARLSTLLRILPGQLWVSCAYAMSAANVKRNVQIGRSCVWR